MCFDWYDNLVQWMEKHFDKVFPSSEWWMEKLTKISNLPAKHNRKICKPVQLPRPPNVVTRLGEYKQTIRPRASAVWKIRLRGWWKNGITTCKPISEQKDGEIWFSQQRTNRRGNMTMLSVVSFWLLVASLIFPPLEVQLLSMFSTSKTVRLFWKIWKVWAGD